MSKQLILSAILILVGTVLVYTSADWSLYWEHLVSMWTPQGIAGVVLLMAGYTLFIFSDS